MSVTRAATAILLSLLTTTSIRAQTPRTITVNRVRLTETQVTDFETRWQVKLQSGSFWYDRVSGAWGHEGGPTAGWILPGQELGGPLQADASRGNTGVFINGRELPEPDVAALMQIVAVPRGRWWKGTDFIAGDEHGCTYFNSRDMGDGTSTSWASPGC